MINKQMREELDRELNSLLQDVEIMGGIVIKALLESVEALLKGDKDLAQKVIRGDDDIDLWQVVIEDKCILLIALQQPLAGDLRRITTALKIVTDLERMGDYAENIAELSLKKKGKYNIEEKYGKIHNMAKEVVYMMEQSLRAYVNSDIVQAEEIHRHDDVVDSYCEELHSEILAHMRDDVEQAESLADLMAIVHYLERAGDHVTNISEWIIYLSTGFRYKVKRGLH